MKKKQLKLKLKLMMEFKQPHLDNSVIEPSEWSNLFKDE